MYKIFGTICALLLVTALTTEWYPILKQSATPTLAYHYPESAIPENIEPPKLPPHLPPITGTYQSLPIKPRLSPDAVKPMKQHYGFDKKVEPVSKPVHERDWFVILKEWLGVITNFLQTIACIFSGGVSYVLWRKQKKEKRV